MNRLNNIKTGEVRKRGLIKQYNIRERTDKTK